MRKKDKKVTVSQRVYEMPSLTNIDFPLINRLIIRLMVPETGISKHAMLFRTIFIRLIDKAIREYYLARKAYISDIEEKMQHFRFLEVADHIETCINATSRLLKLLDRIKTEKESPLFPRGLRKGLDKKSIIDIRNSVEHMDEIIQKDELVPGTPAGITYNKARNGIIISGYELSFHGLATILEKMNEIAQYLLRIKSI